MITNILKYGKRVDPFTFRPYIHVELEWFVESLADIKAYLTANNLTETSDEYYKIIGRSVMEALEDFEPKILVWKDPFTSEELKSALRAEGVKVWSDMEAPTGFPTIDNVVYESMMPLCVVTRRLLQGSTAESFAKSIAKDYKNFALYKLYIPHYNVKHKRYITVSDKEFETLSIDQSGSDNVYGQVCLNELGEEYLVAKIRYAIW